VSIVVLFLSVHPLTLTSSRFLAPVLISLLDAGLGLRFGPSGRSKSHFFSLYRLGGAFVAARTLVVFLFISVLSPSRLPALFLSPLSSDLFKVLILLSSSSIAGPTEERSTVSSSLKGSLRTKADFPLPSQKVIEGVNRDGDNLSSLHTSAGCNMPSSGREMQA